MSVPVLPGVPEHALAVAASALLVASLIATALVVAATLWVRAWAEAGERRRALLAERWTPALLALLDGELAPDAFAADVPARQHPDLLRFLVTYAIRLADDDRQRLAAAAAPLHPLIRRHLGSRSSERRAVGVHALGLLSARVPLVTLGAALRDPSRRVALAAARALTRSRSPRAVRVMLTSVSRFGGAHTANVASLLAQFGLRAGEPITAALVAARTDARARVALATALQRLSYLPAAGPARTLLARPGVDAETQAALLRLLADVGGPVEAAAVRSFVASPSDAVRVQAVVALGRLQCGPEDVVRLRRALRDPNGWVALRAAEALGEPAPRTPRAPYQAAPIDAPADAAP